MTFKKIAKVLLSCVMAGALFTGCGEQPAQKADDANKTDGKIQLGMITHLNATEQRMDEILATIEESENVPLAKYKVKYYDSLKLMQMGIESGSVDQISLYTGVANYLVANNDKYEIASDASLKTLADNFCFAVRKEDTALKADLDKVIEEMKTDGSLDKMVNDYVTNVDKGQDPPKVEIPKTEGAQTIKVGVTGDLPPLDLILADNSPAGFNTALLAEIAKRSGKNIEVVQIESGARAAALSSKQIDVIFWVVVPTVDKFPADIDKPEGVELSTPYFKDNVEHLKLKK
ncbi:MAG: transporter substrate-binding domain-containing protein [Selenomonadaceae bacterium]|nr:transporter substrate-binding domain-containing protein [Selenomonadaceae bacterium]